MDKQEQRVALKRAGWRRCDRTSQGVHIEWWHPPHPGTGMSPTPVSLRAAYRRLQADAAKQDGA